MFFTAISATTSFRLSMLFWLTTGLFTFLLAMLWWRGLLFDIKAATNGQYAAFTRFIRLWFKQMSRRAALIMPPDYRQSTFRAAYWYFHGYFSARFACQPRALSSFIWYCDKFHFMLRYYFSTMMSWLLFERGDDADYTPRACTMPRIFDGARPHAYAECYAAERWIYLSRWDDFDDGRLLRRVWQARCLFMHFRCHFLSPFTYRLNTAEGHASAARTQICFPFTSFIMSYASPYH